MPTNPSTLRLALMAIIVLAAVPVAHARPKVPRSILKTYFQTGDRPPAAQFSLTSLDGEVNTFDPPDFDFLIGTGGIHTFQGISGAQMLADGSGRTLALAPGMVVGDVPTAGQFASLIDSTINRLDDRFFLGLRFTRPDGPHYGYLDVTVDSPLPGWPGFYGFTIHGWAFEDTPNTPITTSFIPAPGCGTAALAILGLGARRRQRVGT